MSLGKWLCNLIDISASFVFVTHRCWLESSCTGGLEGAAYCCGEVSRGQCWERKKEDFSCRMNEICWEAEITSFLHFKAVIIVTFFTKTLCVGWKRGKRLEISAAS